MIAPFLLSSSASTVTVKVQVLPLAVAARMVVVPIFRPVTTPFETDATALLALVHLTDCDAFSGETAALSFRVPLSSTVCASPETLTAVAAGGWTVTLQLFCAPFLVLTVMVAAPESTAVSTPPLTLTTLGLLDVQVQSLVDRRGGGRRTS